MDERNDSDKIDDVMLPGFRFHPTDEELVGFYLKRKIQQKTLPIELIRQVDIYKFDPWDLPKLAPTGEKEWYFYCPRDRKYRNSARPNRVTGAGFWKATGTDRPIYSSDGTKCIGLKKSLVFYRGRAAKGMKTDWMMHEFRLPTLTDSTPPKKFLEKNIPPSDAWAICRIFKKTNSMAQRALSHSWVSPLPESIGTDLFNRGTQCSQFNSENISCTTEIGSAIQLCTSNDLQQASTVNFPTIDIHSYRPINLPVSKSPSFSMSNGDLSNGFMFSPPESGPSKCTSESGSGSMLLGPALIGDPSKASERIDFQGPHQFSGFSVALPQDLHGNVTATEEEEVGFKKSTSLVADGQNQWGVTRSISFPFSLPPSLPDGWKINLPWDSDSPPCPSDMSSGFSTNKCYT